MSFILYARKKTSKSVPGNYALRSIIIHEVIAKVYIRKSTVKVVYVCIIRQTGCFMDYFIICRSETFAFDSGYNVVSAILSHFYEMIGFSVLGHINGDNL